MKRKYSNLLMLFIITIISWSLMSCAHSQERIGHKRTSRHARFTIKRLVIAESVENKEPVGISNTFPVTTKKVYCFLEAADITEDTTISFVWYFEDKKIHSYELPLKQGSSWRTYAYKNLYGKKGNWKVEIKDPAGRTLKTISFKVK